MLLRQVQHTAKRTFTSTLKVARPEAQRQIPKVILYTGKDCSLCDVVKVTLEEVKKEVRKCSDEKWNLAARRSESGLIHEMPSRGMLTAIRQSLSDPLRHPILQHPGRFIAGRTQVQETISVRYPSHTPQWSR